MLLAETACSAARFNAFAFFAALRETSYVHTLLTTDYNEAAAVIRQGGIVAFPTETVYGLGANVFDEKAIANIFEAKHRPADNPLIAHIARIEQIGELSNEVSSCARSFIDSFFPGPLTVVLTKSDKVPAIATAGLDTIGVRMPRFDFARDFLSACGVPVVAPSANLSGRPSPTTWQAVLEDLDGRIDCVLQGNPTEIGLESTVVDCSGAVPMLLREGAVSLGELRAVVPETIEYRPVASDAPRSPGLKHRHYSPTAEVYIVDSTFEISNFKSVAFIGLCEPRNRADLIKVCTSAEEYAHSLFEFFRECDRRGIETIYCEEIATAGIGAALMDRLRRAAE